MSYRSARFAALAAAAAALCSFAPAQAAQRLASAPAAGSLSGVFVADKYNGGPVPAVDHFPSTKGYTHYVKLEEGVVTLRPNGTYVSTWRYYHELVPDGKPVPKLQIKTDSYKGRYVLTGNAIVFKPDPSKTQKNPRQVNGTVVGDRIKVVFPIDDAGIQRTLHMELKRDPTRF